MKIKNKFGVLENGDIGINKYPCCMFNEPDHEDKPRWILGCKVGLFDLIEVRSFSL